MLSNAKHLALEVSQKYCEILHVVQDDNIVVFLYHG